MILYYTGTGNSEFVAKRIAKQLNETTLNCFDKLKKNDCTEIHSSTPWIVVCPTYGWQIPHLFRDWLIQVPLIGSKEIYFIMTCGEDNGDSNSYLERLCDEKKLNYKGCIEVVMPENYIAMFPVPNGCEAKEIIKNAYPLIDDIASVIEKKQDLEEKKITFIDRMKSGLVNQVFYKFFVHAKKFQVSENCTGCGKCVQLCVCDNIQLINQKPKWENHCTHCMACICNCPTQAIEYGSASKNKPRYLCPSMED